MTRKLRAPNQSEGSKHILQAQKRQHTAPGEDSGVQDTPDRKARVWQVVAMIPEGKVASYGQIATLIGLPSHASFVGATLRGLPKHSKLPWHRVVNSSMRISVRGGAETRQRDLLLAEGVTFIGARISSAHRWEASAY